MGICGDHVAGGGDEQLPQLIFRIHVALETGEVFPLSVLAVVIVSGMELIQCSVDGALSTSAALIASSCTASRNSGAAGSDGANSASNASNEFTSSRAVAGVRPIRVMAGNPFDSLSR